MRKRSHGSYSDNSDLFGDSDDRSLFDYNSDGSDDLFGSSSVSTHHGTGWSSLSDDVFGNATDRNNPFQDIRRHKPSRRKKLDIDIAEILPKIIIVIVGIVVVAGVSWGLLTHGGVLLNGINNFFGMVFAALVMALICWAILMLMAGKLFDGKLKWLLLVVLWILFIIGNIFPEVGQAMLSMTVLLGIIAVILKLLL